MFGIKKQQEKSFGELHSEITDFFNKIDEAVTKGHEEVKMLQHTIVDLQKSIDQVHGQVTTTQTKLDWLQELRRVFPENHKTTQVSPE